ncbi:MAG: hypothetical protein AB8G14_03545 [Ilumatobacter sp.]
MDGAESHQRSDIVRSVSSAGWFAFLAWLLFLFRQIARVVQVGDQQFAGIWDQRIEVLSFTVLPPNVLLLVPAAIATTVATYLAGPTQTADLAVQIRIVRWAASFQVGVGVISSLSILINETGSPTEAQDVAMRFAGMAMSVAIIVLTRAAEQSSPGWMSTR